MFSVNDSEKSVAIRVGETIAIRLLKAYVSTIKKQNPVNSKLTGLFLFYLGGPKRIRTAVAAFAELSLTARPSDRYTTKIHN